MATTPPPEGGTPPTPPADQPERVVESSRRPVSPTRTAAPPPTPPGTESAPSVRPGMVMVWPQLVSIEFVAMVVMTLVLVLMGAILNAPLEGLANPDQTPNPSKAPWYFLNLQELLLHMHPSLAGVFIPSIALLAIAAIPYIDFSEEGTGIWFTSPRGLQITIFSAIYTVSILIVLIVFNEFVGVRRLFGWAPVIIPETIIPVMVILGFSALLVLIVRMRWNATTREIIIALFTGFVASFFVLTLVGTAFRGPGMHLFWPWAQPPRTH